MTQRNIILVMIISLVGTNSSVGRILAEVEYYSLGKNLCVYYMCTC